MYCDLNRIDLREDTFAYVYRAPNKENVQTFKKELKDYINTILALLETDFSKLSGVELYNLLHKVYDICFDKEDVLQLFSKRNKRKYDRVTNLYTDETFESYECEGRGKNFSYWKETSQFYYVVAIADNVKLERRSYSKEEIDEMVSKKDVVILKRRDRVIDKNDLDKSYYYDNNYKYDYFDDFSDSIFFDNPEILSTMLRRRFTKKKIYNDMRKYVSELAENIDDVCKNEEENVDDYDDFDIIARRCYCWFRKSNENKKYQRIRKKLGMEKENNQE